MTRCSSKVDWQNWCRGSWKAEASENEELTGSEELTAAKLLVAEVEPMFSWTKFGLCIRVPDGRISPLFIKDYRNLGNFVYKKTMHQLLLCVFCDRFCLTQEPTLRYLQCQKPFISTYMTCINACDSSLPDCNLILWIRIVVWPVFSNYMQFWAVFVNPLSYKSQQITCSSEKTGHTAILIH